MSRIHRLSRSSTLLLLVATAASSPDGTKLVYPGVAAVDGSPRAILIAIGSNGSGMQPLGPAGTAGTFPAWGGSR